MLTGCVKIRYRANFRYVANLLSCFADLHSASKFSHQLQKLIQEKLQKNEKQARTKINLKISENLKRKIKEFKNKIR